ncbi:LacI family DNA-binding transcriptional regulator [Microbaculum marinum]|uniref:LacI family DNA-binding transcriptional regulator n=1 Tax=Microbaculum marinum TaxID=1764581 RepID=A0AAW9RK39_9HYPH
MKKKTGKPPRETARRRHPGRVRVEDVARAAGVSGATVSRALNRSGPVSEDIRKRIERAVLDLGYVPNGAARALASHRTRAIGIVVPTLKNANFAVTAEAAEGRLVEEGYTFLVATNSYSTSRESDLIQSLAAHGIDGLILVGAQRDPAILRFLDARGIPYVVTWTLARGDVPSVGFDNTEAARRLASHLLDLGHKQIGVIAGLTGSNDRAAARLAGVRQALGERGLELSQELLIERPYRIAEGQIALGALLDRAPPLTAIVCGNDQLAFGALIECGRRGIEVPDELSIVGFDDLEFSSQIKPALTTIHVPAAEIGVRAAEYLLAKIAGRPAPVTTTVSVSLIVRESSSPPRTAA